MQVDLQGRRWTIIPAVYSVKRHNRSLLEARFREGAESWMQPNRPTSVPAPGVAQERDGERNLGHAARVSNEISLIKKPRTEPEVCGLRALMRGTGGSFGFSAGVR